MRRRGFDHLHAELSVAVGRRVPRYNLWLQLRELGCNPEQLPRNEAISFCRRHMQSFLADQGLALSPRAERRLWRAIARFDPRHPTPGERMQRFCSGGS